jgi:hypothetical protein
MPLKRTLRGAGRLVQVSDKSERSTLELRNAADCIDLHRNVDVHVEQSK